MIYKNEEDGVTSYAYSYADGHKALLVIRQFDIALRLSKLTITQTRSDDSEAHSTPLGFYSNKDAIVHWMFLTARITNDDDRILRQESLKAAKAVLSKPLL